MKLTNGTKKCCLCGRTIHEPFTNNPYPLCDEDDDESRCCSDCDAVLVIPARIMISKGIDIETIRRKLL